MKRVPRTNSRYPLRSRGGHGGNRKHSAPATATPHTSKVRHPSQLLTDQRHTPSPRISLKSKQQRRNLCRHLSRGSAQVTLNTNLLGVGEVIYIPHTLEPLKELGLESHTTAIKLHRHALEKTSFKSQARATGIQSASALGILFSLIDVGIVFTACHQSRPDAVFVRSNPGPPSHIDPTKIIPQDREIHLVEFEFCPDTNPFATLEAATAQHANAITRLKTRSLRNPNRNNKVTLHVILGGVAGTTYNDYTNKPVINARHALHFQGTSRGGGAGHLAVESRRRRVWASRSIADNPPDPH
eukprot:1157171-Pelagomonas_calceolata.AAC.3